MLTVDSPAMVICQESWPVALLCVGPNFSSRELAPENWTVSCGPVRLTAPAATAYHGFWGSWKTRPEINGSKVTKSAWSSESEVGTVLVQGKAGRIALIGSKVKVVLAVALLPLWILKPISTTG